MNIALIGASGNIGSKILTEALQRGHTVTAVVRNPDRVAPRNGLTVLKGDATDSGSVAPLLAGHDAVVCAIHYSEPTNSALLESVRESGVSRFLVVGGAGSLKLADGVELADPPDFPSAWKAEALSARELLQLLQATDDLDWTYASPSALIAPGERTGVFRLGDNDLLVGHNGQSRISEEDFAIALVDELETPRYPKRRFTVGY